jgi:hypothetical protein
MTLIGELSKLRFVEPNLFIDEAVVVVVVYDVVVEVAVVDVVHVSQVKSSLIIDNECSFTFLMLVLQTFFDAVYSICY